MTEIFASKHGGQIPKTRVELLKLKGIGAAIADNVMKWAWVELDGIPVDMALHAVANRLQWVGSMENG